ncbi:hypothetical protein D3C86_1840330 [compost metagenome]
MGLLDVLRVARDGQHVEPEVAALAGHHVRQLDAVARLFGTADGLEHIPRIAEGDADIAVGQVGDVAR